MYIVLGSTGHVGSEVVAALLTAGCPVTAVTRSKDRAAAWRTKGADAAVVDVSDGDGLRRVLQTGRRAFLLNPPADPSTDTDREERFTASAIVNALDGSGLEKVVVQSTYGAQPGEAVGDLSVLYELEQAVAALPTPSSVLRAGFYMSNWDTVLDAARAGSLPTMYPAQLKLPMAAPADLGQVAARLLQAPVDECGIHYVEGPERYSSQDAADAFADALGRPVEVAVTPREEWEAAYRKLGFSGPAAAAYTRMTAVAVDGDYDMPGEPERGKVTLQNYVRALVRRSG
jgi:uncharacterized protein YbjT (DUF2867 family)